MSGSITSYPYISISERNQSEVHKRDIKEVASEFESLFIYYMLKTMRKSVIKSNLFGNSRGEEIYRSLLDEKLSIAISEAGGIGLKDMIIRDLKAYDTEREERSPSEMKMQEKGK